MKNFIPILIALIVCSFLSNNLVAQGTLGEYAGGSATGGFDSGCGYLDAGNADIGVADAGLAGNVCGSAFDVTFGAWTESATGFDISGFELNNYDIDDEAAYGIRLFYGPQNNCCTICLDAMIDLGQGAACGTFGPQASLASFGFPIPATYGADIFGADIIPYADMCPNTEYFAQYQFISATAVDLTDPDGNLCAMDDALITNSGTQSTVQTFVAPGTRDPIVINSATLVAASPADCASTDVMLDFSADITAGCTVSFGTCSQGLELEIRASLICANGSTIDINTGPLVNDPTACLTGGTIAGQISLGEAADICAIAACDPNASLEFYARYTFCEADDLNGDGSGNDEMVMSVPIASILADFDAAMCCASTCPEFNAVSYGPICNGYDICIGYADTDADGIGDNGEDPTGIVMTVVDGLANSVAQAPINDGVFLFDADGDGNNDAVGYCLTLLFDNPTCDPEAYTPLVSLTCADGTAGVFNAAAGGATITGLDILSDQFGIAGGTAIYPALTGVITAPVCPTLADNSDAVAGFVEVFVADANGAPTATSCTIVQGPTPACGVDNTADPAANSVPVQFNPIADPLLSAVVGAGTFTCGLDAVADLSSACPACDPGCVTTVPAETGNNCSDGTVMDLCGACSITGTNAGNSNFEDYCGGNTGLTCPGSTFTLDGTGGASWVSFVGDGGTYTFNLIGSDFDTQMAIVTDDGAGCFACEFGNDDDIGLVSQITDFATVAGTTYWIVIDGFAANNGTWVLNVLEDSSNSPSGYPEDAPATTITCPSAAESCPAIPAVCEADAPEIDPATGDCATDDGDMMETPFTWPLNAASTENTTAPYITEYIVTDATAGTIIGVFPTLAAAEAAANTEIIGGADGDMSACIQAINHDGTNLEAIITDLDAQTGGLVCGILPCPVSTLEAFYGAISALGAIDVATVVAIIGPPNVGATGLDLGALLGLPPGSIVVDVLPFCYELGAEVCATNAACPVLTGCTDPCADNFDPNAVTDDGSCNPYDDTCNADCTAGPFGGTWDAATCACINETTPVNGCTDATACNFDAAANCDDGSCIMAPTCNTDPCAGDIEGIDPSDPCACIVTEPQVFGCTNPAAPEFSAAANCDDGSCSVNPPVDIPTLSQWGLITLALLLATFGAITMTATKLAFAGTSTVPMPFTNISLPFNAAVLRKALKITGVLALLGFAICFAIFGAIFMPDIIGVAIAGPVFAYLAHLIYLIEKK